MKVYDSDIDDNRRWLGFTLRDGDVVVSTRSKHGTTWVQMLCLQLVLQGADLPGPLGEVAPWVDWRGEPLADLDARLARQPHRRVLKTHTPLDGVPIDPRATYVVVGRHPLDAAASLYHQADNIDRDRVAQLMGEAPPPPRPPRPSEADWVRAWASDESTTEKWQDSPAGVLHHLSDAWARAGHQPVLLLHYADLLAQPAVEVRRLATALSLDVTDGEVARVVDASGFQRMRARAGTLAPGGGTFKDPAAFFRSGGATRGRDLLGLAEQEAFESRCHTLAPSPVVDWLLR